MEADVRVVVAVLVFLALFETAAAYSARSIGEDAQGRSMPWHAYNTRTESDADTSALMSCNQRGLFNCRITHRWSKICVASWIDMRMGHEHIATAHILDHAREQAARQCANAYLNAHANCRPGVAYCDTGVANPNEPGYVPPPTAAKTEPHRSMTEQPKTTTLGRYLFANAVEIVRDNHIVVISLTFLLAGLLIVSKLKRPSNLPIVTTPSFIVPPLTASPPILNAPPSGSRMQVSIKHSQERNGFWIALDLRFSQDTINLIKARRLEDYVVIKGYIKPQLSTVGVYGTVYGLKALAYVVPFAFIASIILVLGRYDIGGYLFLASIAAFFWLWFDAKKIFTKREQQTFTIGSFFRNPHIRLYADDALSAKMLDQNIREALQTVRAMLDESVSLPTSETFEL